MQAYPLRRRVTLPLKTTTFVLATTILLIFSALTQRFLSSDKRDKADITNFTHGLDWINQMQPVTYRWDRRSWYLDDPNGDITSITPDGSHKRQRINLGLLAQDVLEIETADGRSRFTAHCQQTDDERLKDRIVPVLINAVKELSAEMKHSRLDWMLQASKFTSRYYVL